MGVRPPGMAAIRTGWRSVGYLSPCRGLVVCSFGLCADAASYTANQPARCLAGPPGCHQTSVAAAVCRIHASYARIMRDHSLHRTSDTAALAASGHSAAMAEPELDDCPEHGNRRPGIATDAAFAPGHPRHHASGLGGLDFGPDFTA